MKGKRMRGRGILKKWGGSLGLVISKDAARDLDLGPGSVVVYELRPDVLRIEDIRGILRDELKGVDWKKMDEQLAKGWHES
jgi:antitoxin component of MazEF toxin-antitoxin module